MPKETLGERLRRRDRDRFVGRRDELQALDALLSAAEPEVSVVLVHGEGGIGKSTLLREAARRAEESGATARLVDARDFAPVPGEIEAALHGVDRLERPLVLIDHWERISALGAHLRAEVLPGLPARALVVIASRTAPEAEWGRDGWEHVTLELELGALSDAEGAELLEGRGLRDADAIRHGVALAGGSPLGLALAADAALSGELPTQAFLGTGTVGTLLRRIADTELQTGNHEVAAVAAIARRATEELLADALPGTDAREAMHWLGGLSFAQASGPGIVLHDLARTALLEDLELRSPTRERELRRRIADHLAGRALAGNPWLIVDLFDLLRGEGVRWGFAEGSPDYRVDTPRASDLAALEREVVQRTSAMWWDGIDEVLEGAPERAVVARDRQDRPVGYCIAATPANAPPIMLRERLLGPWLEHLRVRFPEGDAMVVSDLVDLTADGLFDPSSTVTALLNMAAVLRSGLTSPRHLYVVIDPANETAVAFAQQVGAVRVDELTYRNPDQGFVLHCYHHDLGPGGVVLWLRDAVYRELGVAPPPRQGETTTPALVAGSFTAQDVHDALRDLHRPDALAASPLAGGETPAARARSVRELLEGAVDGAFGASGDEQRLRRLIQRVYVEGGTGHEAIADELDLARSTYFRRLRVATQRVADWLLQPPPG